MLIAERVELGTGFVKIVAVRIQILGDIVLSRDLAIGCDVVRATQAPHVLLDVVNAVFKLGAGVDRAHGGIAEVIHAAQTGFFQFYVGTKNSRGRSLAISDLKAILHFHFGVGQANQHRAVVVIQAEVISGGIDIFASSFALVFVGHVGSACLEAGERGRDVSDGIFVTAIEYGGSGVRATVNGVY